MECVVRIEMDNAAFFRHEENLEGDELLIRDGCELARLLRVAADSVANEGGFLPGGRLYLRDINGNTVGSLDFEGEW